jgi:hypothetical protein
MQYSTGASLPLANILLHIGQCGFDAEFREVTTSLSSLMFLGLAEFDNLVLEIIWCKSWNSFVCFLLSLCCAPSLKRGVRVILMNFPFTEVRELLIFIT